MDQDNVEYLIAASADDLAEIAEELRTYIETGHEHLGHYVEILQKVTARLIVAEDYSELC